MLSYVMQTRKRIQVAVAHERIAARCVTIIGGLSDEHRDAALSMLMDDRIQGEQNEAFMARCREIATARLGQPQAAGG
ncbi:hypothetical protein THIOKS13200005 [Thiocapsa sp. KS1]|nr:hypothetical protein THIOKS13200005 [Thiocapsa sp. KS1]